MQYCNSNNKYLHDILSSKSTDSDNNRMLVKPKNGVIFRSVKVIYPISNKGIKTIRRGTLTEIVSEKIEVRLKSIQI